MGTDVSGRAAALISGRADATLLTAPNYFRLEEQGYKNLANLADHDDIYAATTYLLDFDPMHFNRWLGLAASLFLSATVSWLALVLPTILRSVPRRVEE